MKREGHSAAAVRLAGRESHIHWSPIFDPSDLAIALLSAAFDFCRVNFVFAASDGKSPDDFRGCNLFRLHPNPALEALFRQAARTGRSIEHVAKPLQYGLDPRRGVGRYNWWLDPLPDANGYAQHFLLVMQDVTASIRAMEREIEANSPAHPDR
jgi:PAS domain-containing protein